MSISSSWITALALVLVVALPVPGRAQSAAPPSVPSVWPVTSAPARFDIDSGQLPATTRLIWATINLPDPKWAGMSVRVFTEKGVPVASEFLAPQPGEQAVVLFDSSSGSWHYSVYVGSNWPPLHLPDTKMGVWLETRDGDGKVITTLPDMLQAWDHAPPSNRRVLLNSIFEGGNRFGPQTNLLLHLQGYFDLPSPQHLDFADSSIDASFVLVDGKEVVEWPGQHDRGWGPSGPPQGGVDLAAGAHVIDYYNAYIATPDGNPPLSCALAVKGGAYPDWTMLTSDKTFFRNVGLSRVGVYELQKDVPGAGTTGGPAPALAFGWMNGDQCVIRTDLADIGMIQIRFQCLLKTDNVLTWTFDDGTTVQGHDVTHVFLRPGMRTVRLSMKQGDKEVGALEQVISVHIDWTDTRKGPEPHPELFNDLMSRDTATLPVSDLVSVFALAQHWLRTDALLKLAPALTAKMSTASDADLATIQKGATSLAREDWSHTAEEIALLHALIDRCGQGTPSPDAIKIGSQARLALARLVYKTSDKLDDVKALVDAINVPSLTGEEPHILDILKADLLFAAGDVPGARKEYVRLTGDPTGPDARSSIRRTAKIGQARSYMDSKDYDAAEGALNEVAWKSPIEKLSPDWALTRLRLYQEEGLSGPAYVWAKRLMPVLTEGGRSDLLFRLTDLAFAQGDNDLAKKTLSELLQKHPYSEEAAQAKQKWPGKASW